MEKISYKFITQISFSEEIQAHSFLLRCTPQHLPFQKVISEQCVVTPIAELCVGTDSFGNIVHSGHIDAPHSGFEFCSEGELMLDTYRICEELNPIFLYPSDYTQPLEYVEQFYQTIVFHPNNSIAQKIAKIGAKVHGYFIYETGSTTIKTTAGEALLSGRGVCQDFAHIMIALCRRANIPTRYVAGFLQGESFTHAWIEFYEAGIWLPFDPTHNRWIEQGYIKLAHGRDYADCPIERGVFNGVTNQTLNINLSVESIEQ
jgi:transglutaminase-like putative cysteine protease